MFYSIKLQNFNTNAHVWTWKVIDQYHRLVNSGWDIGLDQAYQSAQTCVQQHTAQLKEV